MTAQYLHVGYASHVGLVRSHNEDSLLVLTASQLGLLSPVEPLGVFVLADGMGGHEAGEVASMLAVRIVAQNLLKDILIPYLDSEPNASPRKPISDAMSNAVEVADRMIRSQVAGGGTTLTCALVMGDHVHIAHVGDSRAYMLVNGELRQITSDHSLIDRLVEMGQITPDEALHHPHRNVLYRAVGQGDGLDVDTYVEPMLPGDQVLLCSDGLWGMVEDDRIASILARKLSCQQTCDALVEVANEAGGKDNVTAILTVKEE